MKVLYLVNIPSPYRVDFFNELGKICDLTVIFEQKYSKDREKSWHNYNFKNFKGHFLKGIDFKKTKVNLEVISFLKKKDYDCVVIGGYSSLTGILSISYLKWKKIPFILNVDGGLIKDKENKLKYAIKKYFISSASYWLSTGELTTKYLTYYGAKSNKILLYPFTTLYEKDIEKNILNSKNKTIYKQKLRIKEEKVIVTVGRFIYSKGFDVLLEACNSISSSVGVYIIGGEATEEYLEIIKKFDLKNVYFISFKSKEELSQYYIASDLFVLPTRSDVWGLVINEAMSYGLPIVTTNSCVAGVELVENYTNGFIVPVDDVLELSDKINTILSDELLLKKMSNESYKKIKNYSLENMALITKKNLESTLVKVN